MDYETVKKNEKSLILGFSNTYTYTKSLAERHIERYRGNLRVLINRPSYITHCSYEPLPGWIDTISAIAAISFPCGMGY